MLTNFSASSGSQPFAFASRRNCARRYVSIFSPPRVKPPSAPGRIGWQSPSVAVGDITISSHASAANAAAEIASWSIHAVVRIDGGTARIASTISIAASRRPPGESIAKTIALTLSSVARAIARFRYAASAGSISPSNSTSRTRAGAVVERAGTGAGAGGFDAGPSAAASDDQRLSATAHEAARRASVPTWFLGPGMPPSYGTPGRNAGGVGGAPPAPP